MRGAWRRGKCSMRIFSNYKLKNSANYALVCLLALIFTGLPDAFSHERKHHSHHWPGGDFHKWKKGGEKHKRHKHAHDHIGRHRHQHGNRSRNWGNLGSSACGRGQGSCASSSGSGYRGLASALGSAASQLSGQSRELQNLQKEIVQDSLNDSPGRDNPDARRFDEGTKNGTSRFSDFTEASDPIVQEQIAMYNDIGDTRDELDAEAEKYQEQEKEMNALADKSESNADNLVSKNNGVSGIQGGAGQGGKPDSTIAKDEAGNVLANVPTGNQNISSDISNSTTERDSSKDAKYPVKLSNAEQTSSALESTGPGSTASVKGDLRDTLRARLRDASGSSSPTDEYSDNEPAPFGVGGQAANASGNSSARKNEKKPRPTVDSANDEESISPFESGLGSASIALAGSETEASVQAMLKEFGESKEGSREPASMQNSEIGSKEGPSLFERCRATYKRCAKNGCVTFLSVERAGG